MSAPTDCPSEDTLLAFVEGQLGEGDARAVEAHAATCDACTEVLAEAGRALVGSSLALSTGPVPTPVRALPEIGQRLGRYQIMEVLGRGAMGVVYAAWDPELDRRVALKVVRVTRALGQTQAELEARIVAEAQAMARLQHPHVVAVYDIGTSEHGVFIAMELVRGVTLERWLAAAPRAWREVIDVFLGRPRASRPPTAQASCTATSSRRTRSSRPRRAARRVCSSPTSACRVSPRPRPGTRPPAACASR